MYRRYDELLLLIFMLHILQVALTDFMAMECYRISFFYVLFFTVYATIPERLFTAPVRFMYHIFVSKTVCLYLV